jgi:hypothetical protein
MALSHPSFQCAGRKIAVDLPHLAFASAIAGWVAWYCCDAALAQASVSNLIMILPASLAALALYLTIAVGCFRVVGPAEPPEPLRKPLALGLAAKIAAAMALLVAYAVSAPWIGFDVASFTYVFATLVLLGERRPLALVLIPGLFCVSVIYVFGTVMATPLPLLLVPDGLR